MVGIYNYNHTVNTKKLLIENKKQQIKVLADSVRYKITVMLDNMMYQFNSNQLLHEKIFTNLVNTIEKNPNYNLDKIKRVLDNQYSDREFDILLINKEMIVYDGTYKPDIGLDFHNLPAAYEIVKLVYDRKKDIDISWPLLEYHTKNYIQYYLTRPDNKNYLVQLSVRFDKEFIINQFYDQIKTSTPNLLQFSLYNLFKSDHKDNVKIENILNNILVDKNEYTKQKEEVLEFGVFYKNIFNKEIPNDTETIDKQLQNKITKEGAITYIEKVHNRYYITLLIDSTNYQSIQEPSVVNQYLMMKFDITNEFNEIEKIEQQNYLFSTFYIGIVFLLLAILYKKVFDPLYKLNKSMSKVETVDSINYLNSEDEISTIIVSYNKLLKDLNQEIDKNQFLLNENKQFIADTVHQIRTPLANIMMNGDMIRLYKKDEKLSSFIDQINASISMLNNSYEDLSYITTFDTIDYNPVSVILSDVLKNRVKFFETISKVNRKVISLHLDSNIEYTINAIELERLIDNNISNCIKYADINKVISISLTKENNKAILEFKTYGKPIKDVSKIFNKNYREDNGKRGLGLGLYMVKNICDKYNITYKVSYLNKQNIFTYTLELL